MLLKNALIFLLIVSAVALYMLSVATAKAGGVSEHFWSILGFNVAIVFLLLYVLIKQAWKLRNDLKQKIYGAKLAQSMIRRFTLVAVLPGLFLFAVSSQFIGHSIHTWFGDGTREALDRSARLSKVALDKFSDRITMDARLAGYKIKYGLQLGQPIGSIFSAIATDLGKFEQVSILNMQGDMLFVSSPNGSLPLPYPANLDWMTIRSNPLYTSARTINQKLYVEVSEHIYLPQQEFILLFREKVPSTIATDVKLILNAKANYEELTYHQKGLQIILIITLLVSTLLSIFMALLASIFFSRRFVEPLAALSESTYAVSQGDFSRRNPVLGNDELAQLSERFNNMTDQLCKEKEHSGKLYEKQQEARRYFESVLLNLTTGVITLDEQSFIKTYNVSVENILGFSLQPYIGIPWPDWPTEDIQVRFLKAFIEKLVAQVDGPPLEFEYSANDVLKILLGKVAHLEVGKGFVLVFDDVTQLATAQKEAAWGEVARRLAHEIKNPLTPIQLSAERVQNRLESKLSKADAQLLRKSTNTIVKQVMALKEMVESFRNYSRSVTLKLERIDFNELVKEVVSLYEGLDCTFDIKLGKMELAVNVDSTSIRQVLHNILKNASEAASVDEHPLVSICTEVSNGQVVLLISNNGRACDPAIIAHAFEPYVTDKKDGTGLGLSVVKKIVEEHGGTVSLVNNKNGIGATVTLTLSLIS